VTRLTEKERENMIKILNQDLKSINAKIMYQFEELWERTRTEIEDELGCIEKRMVIEKLEKQMGELRHQINEIQHSMREYAETPSLKEYEEAGLGVPENRNGAIYRHNVEFMGVTIQNKIDLLIAKRLKETTDPMKPVRMLQEIAESSVRAVVMSGTFEEAREAYKTFYSLNWRQYGVEIPRLLGEIKSVAGPNLLSAVMVLALPEPEKSQKKVSG
jgi:chromosome segregation ATPase